MSPGITLPRPWLLRALELETTPLDGGTTIVRAALQALQEAAAELPENLDPQAARAQLETYAARLCRAQAGNASLLYYVERALAALPTAREAAPAAFGAVLDELEQSTEAVIRSAASIFRPGARLLALGYSDSVLAVLTRYADTLERVTVSEGRPLNGGVRLAEALGQLALPVRLITEAQLELFLPECDLVVAAAERVLPDGSLVAAAGTALLARLGAAHGLPFYALADRSRWPAPNSELARFSRERRNPGDVLRNAPPGVEVSNLAWDLTPAALITRYVTETGLQPATLQIAA